MTYRHLCAMGFSVLIAAQTGVVAQVKPARQAETKLEPTSLGNSDIVKLVQSGLSDAFVIARIRQESNRKFDLSSDGLIQLSKAGVSEAVLAVMLDPSASTPSQPAPPAAPTNVRSSAPSESTSGVSMREPGIYMELATNPSPVQLEPTVFSQGKSGGVFASAMTYGLYKAKWKAVVRSAKANIRTDIQHPTFLFYFPQKSAEFGAGVFAGWLSAATSPNEFVLAQMTRKKTDRELIVGEFGAMGTSSGTRSQDTVPMTIHKLAPGVYRVTPGEILGPGEFCFFYGAGAGSLGQGAGGKLFDFGIDPPVAAKD